MVNLTTTLREHFVALIEIEMNLIIKFIIIINPENKCKFPALSSQFNKNNYYDTGTCFLELLIFSERRLVRSHSKGREGFEMFVLVIFMPKQMCNFQLSSSPALTTI